MSTTTNNPEVAKTILRQIGGIGRVAAMTGAKNFVDNGSGVYFNIGRNAKGVNLVEINLNSGTDTYDVAFKYVTIRSNKVKAEYSDIYADQLVGLIERNTGMYLSL